MNIKKSAIKMIRGLAKSLGYEITPTWRINEIPLEKHLSELFEKYEIDVVIDVGANTGQYRDMLRNEVGFRGKIFSFEPVRSLANQIKARSPHDGAWHIYDCALGSESGEANINVARESTLTSFLSPKSGDGTGILKAESITHNEMVQIRTLDDVLSEANIDCASTRVYLKLDTQGFDLEVLKGAKKSIQNIVALQTEASILPIYENMPNYQEVLENLKGLGFEISGMFPVTYDQKLRLIEFDCIMINRRFLK